VSVRVVVADDQALVRSGFGMILGAAGIEVVGEAGDGEQALQSARRLRPDVVLMDIRMPGMDGLEATRRLLGTAPTTEAGDPVRVIILTTFDLDEYVYAALHSGASGFLLKDVTPDHLVHAVRLVRAGDALLAPSITRRLVERFTRPGRAVPAAHAAVASLTAREREVLVLLAGGLSNSELAAALHLGEATVKTHVARILAKPQLRDRVQAACWPTRPGWSRRALRREGLVDELAELRAERVGARREQLGEEGNAQAGLLIHPERGARRPAPGEFAC
jgi:DNA-binding NarL/FixJ family response regulator